MFVTLTLLVLIHWASITYGEAIDFLKPPFRYDMIAQKCNLFYYPLFLSYLVFFIAQSLRMREKIVFSLNILKTTTGNKSESTFVVVVVV